MSALAPLLVLHLMLASEGAAGTFVVMPLEAKETKSADRWIGQAAAEELPKALARLGTPALTRWDRLRVYEALEIPPAAQSLASALRIAESAGVSRAVVGTFSVEAGTVSFSVKVVDLDQATLSAPLVAAGPREGLIATLDSLAWEIAAAGGAAPAMTLEAFQATRPAVPFPALAFYVRGLTTGDPSAKERLLRSALKRLPSYADARFALGRLEMERGDHIQAAETLARIPSDCPLARRARFARGVALIKVGRYREADDLYRDLAIADASAAVLNNRALALLRQGDAAQATSLLRHAMDRGPEMSELPLNLAWALFSRGEFEAAAFWAREILRERPADAYPRLILTWALDKAGRLEEAEKEWRALLSSAPGYAELRRPDPTRRLERILDAERLVVPSRDARSDQELAVVHAGRAEKLRAAGDLESATRELTRAAYLDPHNPRVHSQLAEVHEARGDRELAVNELRMSLWCREDAIARDRLGALLRQLGRDAEAEREVRAAPGTGAATKR
jgi:Flp pilus assembly protein TadD